MIRKASLKDAQELFSCENQLFSSLDFPLSLGSFYYHLKRNDIFIFIKDNNIVGYILWLKRKDYYRLYSIGVLKEFRGLNIAQRLLEFSFETLDTNSYSLEVKTTNSGAIRLYEKNGFKIKKVLTAYYPNNIDGYLMQK